MITATRQGARLFDRTYKRGETVPPAEWNKLPKWKQETLLRTGRYLATEEEPDAAPTQKKARR